MSEIGQNSMRNLENKWKSRRQKGRAMQREVGADVWLSREQYGWGKDEKAVWCTPGHGSAGTPHHSQNFYSHLKNTLRRKNANNETSSFHVLLWREGERRRRRRKSLLFNELQIPNVPVKQQAEVKPGEREKKEELWHPWLCSGRWAEKRREELFCHCEMKMYNKAFAVSLHAHTRQEQRINEWTLFY